MSRDHRYYCVYIMGVFLARSISVSAAISTSGSSCISSTISRDSRLSTRSLVCCTGSLTMMCTRLWRGRRSSKGGVGRRRSVSLCGAIHTGWTWLPSGTRGCVQRVGMLRLRSEGRFALLTAPLSMTKSKFRFSRITRIPLWHGCRFCLRVQLVDLLFVALLNYPAAEL
jgi:hypothetical protein